MGKASRSRRNKFHAEESSLSLKPATEKRLAGYVSGATAEQHDSHTRNISACWLTAAAAGLGMLAWPSAADAKIITSNAQMGIHCSEHGTSSQLFDIGNNGVAQLGAGAHCFFHSFLGTARGHLFAASSRAGFLAGPLKAGVRVGPGDAFTRSTGSANGYWESRRSTIVASHVSGSWANVSGDIGLRFLIDGQVYYGWTYLSVSLGEASYSAFTGPIYYNSVANQPILTGQTGETPEPGTLGLLALGALGLGFWRRKQLASS